MISERRSRGIEKKRCARRNAEAGPKQESEDDNEYLKKREENIARNKVRSLSAQTRLPIFRLYFQAGMFSATTSQSVTEPATPLFPMTLGA